MREEVSFWVAVGLIAVASVVLFKLMAAKVGDRWPALAEVGAFI